MQHRTDSGGAADGHVPYQPAEIAYTPFTVPDVLYLPGGGQCQFVTGLPRLYEGSGCWALLPVVVFFAMFQIISLHARKRHAAASALVVGVAYTYVGLVLFLTGVNVGFMPAGNYLGSAIGRASL